MIKYKCGWDLDRELGSKGVPQLHSAQRVEACLHQCLLATNLVVKHTGQSTRVHGTDTMSTQRCTVLCLVQGHHHSQTFRSSWERFNYVFALRHDFPVTDTHQPRGSLTCQRHPQKPMLCLSGEKLQAVPKSTKSGKCPPGLNRKATQSGYWAACCRAAPAPACW